MSRFRFHLTAAYRSTIGMVFGILILASCAVWTGGIVLSTHPVVQRLTQSQQEQCQYLLERNHRVVQFWTQYAVIQDDISFYNPSKKVKTYAHSLANLDRAYAKEMAADAPNCSNNPSLA